MCLKMILLKVSWFTYTLPLHTANVIVQLLWQQDINTHKSLCPTEMPNGTRSYTLVQQAKSWGDAVRYCRQYYTDLVSILSVTENEAVMEAANSGYTLWIGLYNDRQNWMWSDGEDVVYASWMPGVFSQSGLCGKVDSDGYWKEDDCSKSLPFIQPFTED
uniref:C-type lectin domain-containing protein n=1 Tax=Scleropages formosus TaxID=113540 RepID=A0A8C9RL21_SCLFO